MSVPPHTLSTDVTCAWTNIWRFRMKTVVTCTINIGKTNFQQLVIPYNYDITIVGSKMRKRVYLQIPNSSHLLIYEKITCYISNTCSGFSKVVTSLSIHTHTYLSLAVVFWSLFHSILIALHRVSINPLFSVALSIDRPFSLEPSDWLFVLPSIVDRFVRSLPFSIDIHFLLHSDLKF